MKGINPAASPRPLLLPVILGLLLALLTLALWADSAAAEQPLPRPHYDLRVDLNLEAAYLTAVETVSFINLTGDALSTIVFNIPAAYLGGFSLADASVDGEPVYPTQVKESLEVPLPKPLAPGAQVRVILHFRLDLPPGDGRFGYSGGVVALGNWYPVLAVYEQGWQSHPYSDIGDPYFTEVADYDVFLATSSPAVVIATGEAVSARSKAWHFRARQVRDFAMAISPRYRLLSQETRGVTITVAYLPNHAAGAARALEIAGASLSWYNARVGPYPYRTLSIAETVAQKQHHTAQEHAALIFLRSDVLESGGLYLDILTAHEVAHQWFFGVVGNDQIRHPWLDEALVTALSLDFFRWRDPDAYQSLWGAWGNYTGTIPLNRSIYDFQGGTAYFDAVYRRGATFLNQLQELMGQDAYWQALKTYYATHRFGIARPQDLLLAMRVASPLDPISLYRRTFDYDFLQLPDPVITMTVPGQVVAGTPLRVPFQAQGAIHIAASFDGHAIPIESQTLLLGPDLLTIGEHALQLEAFGQGIGYARRRSTLAVIAPPPTPTPTPLPSPTATPEAGPSPTPSPMPATTDAQAGYRAVWTLIIWLALATLLGLLSGWKDRVKLR